VVSWLRKNWAIISIVAGFLMIEVWRLDVSGPHFDEGIYVLAGERTLQGYGLSDGYLAWFGGSLAYPVLASLSYSLGGLMGARLFGVLCIAAATVIVYRLAVNEFGQRSGPWAAFIFASASGTLFTAKLAVYDVAAVPALALAYWLTSKASKEDNRIYFLLAGLACGFGFLFKYVVIFFIPSIVGFILASRRRWAFGDVALFSIGPGIMGAGLVALAPDQLYRMLTVEDFGANTAGLNLMAWYLGYNWGVYLVLALIGALVSKSRNIAIALLVGVFVMPIAHVAQMNVLSIMKHAMWGLIAGAPLIGSLMARLWSGYLARLVVGLVVVVVSALTIYYLPKLEQSYPDIRDTAQFVRGQMQSGDRVIANHSWAYRLEIHDFLNTPWDLADEYMVSNDLIGDLGQYKWFINEHDVFAFDPQFVRRIRDEASWELVYTNTVYNMPLQETGYFFKHPIVTEVWRKR
jgi:4-amino-4-deoxy-L-arabinose transferase-like glycosyltransferase